MAAKRFFAILLTICLLLSIAACSNANQPPETQITQPSQTTVTTTEPTESTETEPAETAPNESVITPLLYKVTDENGNVIWLFGSIHVGEEYFYPLPDYVLDAYASSDSLAVECDIVAFEKDLSAQMSALKQLVYSDGSKISDHLPEELYTAAVDVLKNYGVYNAALDYYCPALWFSFIDSAMYEDMGVDSTLGIDMHLLNRAHKEEKKIVEIESAEFQYGMLAGFSEELQIILLESSVESYHNSEESMQELHQLVDAWASGDEALITSLLYEEVEFENAEEEALYAEYEDAMITSRNLSMTDFAENALLSGEEVFICVGAAHVVGEGAMAQLLMERGYTVEIVENP